MKYTAKAPANIALIKYWGKSNESLRLPTNTSISINLSGVFTITSVDFNSALTSDEVLLNEKTAPEKDRQRIIEFLDLVRCQAHINTHAKVVSSNNFPAGTGMASSASGFAALALAASKSAGLNLSEKYLSILARVGSGSACRSIPDGFVEWKAGRTNSSSYAHSLFPSDYWNISIVTAIINKEIKKISSSEGHQLVNTSPLFKARLQYLPKHIKDIKHALSERNYSQVGSLTEAECLNMHAIMLTSKPSLIYWLPDTLELMHSIINWRSEGLETYFTIDAGPNVHILCQNSNVPKLIRKLKNLSNVKQVIVSCPSPGATLI